MPYDSLYVNIVFTIPPHQKEQMMGPEVTPTQKQTPLTEHRSLDSAVSNLLCFKDVKNQCLHTDYFVPLPETTRPVIASQ